MNPRGARPIEHGFKAQDTCQTKEWPMCTDDDWVCIIIYLLFKSYIAIEGIIKHRKVQ